MPSVPAEESRVSEYVARLKAKLQQDSAPDDRWLQAFCEDIFREGRYQASVAQLSQPVPGRFWLSNLPLRPLTYTVLTNYQVRTIDDVHKQTLTWLRKKLGEEGLRDLKTRLREVGHELMA